MFTFADVWDREMDKIIKSIKHKTMSGNPFPGSFRVLTNGDDTIKVHYLVPGVDIDDIDVEHDADRSKVIIRARQKPETDELVFGTVGDYEYVFYLHPNMKIVDTVLKNGILEFVIRYEKKANRIPIRKFAPT